MKIVTLRPVDFEVLFDEVRPILVHSFHQLHRLFLALSLPLEPAHLFFKRSVDEHVKGVGTLMQIVGRSAAHDHSVALVRGGAHQLFRHLADAFRVGQLHAAGRGQVSFEAAAQKRLEKPVVKRISTLLALLDVTMVALEMAGDLAGKKLIPQFPAESFGDASGDVCRAAAVFPLERHDSDHGLAPFAYPTAASAPAARGSFFFRRNVNTNITAAPTARTLNVSM